MKKLLIVILLFITFTISNISVVQAETLNDMQKKLDKLKSELATANSSKKLTEEEINSLNKEIVTINVNISKAKADIKSAEKTIVNSQEEIEAKKEECNQLLQMLQLSGDDNLYLEYIFEADSYTDMIYRYAIVSQMTNYNNGVMDELSDLIAKLENKKVELANKQKNLESEQAKLSNKLITLNANLKELTEEGTDIKDDIAYLEKQIKYYKNTLGCSMNQEVSTCLKSVTSAGGVTINAKGWKAPLNSGCVSSNYVGYGQRLDWSGPASGHHGIDLACNSEGTNVYPAAPGIVARIAFSTCGGNQVFIYHTVNGVKYTTSYLHLLRVNVSTNQVVDTSTVIGAVGGGSTASRNGGYDRCTTGAHLHFGTASGWNASSSSVFNSYAFNPRNIFNFPAVGGGYFYK